MRYGENKLKDHQHRNRGKRTKWGNTGAADLRAAARNAARRVMQGVRAGRYGFDAMPDLEGASKVAADSWNVD